MRPRVESRCVSTAASLTTINARHKPKRACCRSGIANTSEAGVAPREWGLEVQPTARPGVALPAHGKAVVSTIYGARPRAISETTMTVRIIIRTPVRQLVRAWIRGLEWASI